MKFMSGKLGVVNTKTLITLVKLGAISVLQQVAKDGFQPVDLIAPLGSKQFQDTLEANLTSFVKVIPELTELDMWDGAELGKHAYAAWLDVKTELHLAADKMKVLKI